MNAKNLFMPFSSFSDYADYIIFSSLLSNEKAQSRRTALGYFVLGFLFLGLKEDVQSCNKQYYDEADHMIPELFAQLKEVAEAVSDDTDNGESNGQERRAHLFSLDDAEDNAENSKDEKRDRNENYIVDVIVRNLIAHLHVEVRYIVGEADITEDGEFLGSVVGNVGGEFGFDFIAVGKGEGQKVLLVVVLRLAGGGHHGGLVVGLFVFGNNQFGGSLGFNRGSLGVVLFGGLEILGIAYELLDFLVEILERLVGSLLGFLNGLYDVFRGLYNACADGIAFSSLGLFGFELAVYGVVEFFVGAGNGVNELVNFFFGVKSDLGGGSLLGSVRDLLERGVLGLLSLVVLNDAGSGSVINLLGFVYFRFGGSLLIGYGLVVSSFELGSLCSVGSGSFFISSFCCSDFGFGSLGYIGELRIVFAEVGFFGAFVLSLDFGELRVGCVDRGGIGFGLLGYSSSAGLDVCIVFSLEIGKSSLPAATASS